MKKIYFFLFLVLALFFIEENCFALEQNEKLWLALNAQQHLSEDKKWLSFIYTQFRFINESHPWQATLLEGGIGYQLFPDKSVWLGYRWTGHRPNNGFYQENRLFQQIILQKKLSELYQFISRSRLEEIEVSNENQIALRLRQRLALEIKKQFFFTDLFPFLYDELFFQLNNTDFTPHKLIGENRLFIGGNLYQTKQTWWEVGYMNQLQMKTPNQNHNRMSHILSITYSFA